MGAVRWMPAAFAALTLSCAVAPLHASEPQASLWPRLVARMQLVNDQQEEIIAGARRLARHPDAVQRMLARSEPFLWYIAEAVERFDLPAEVALLPAVESGFDPMASSPRQAQGLWQLLPSTGRALGLHASHSYNPRRDPLASTDAAMLHLRSLYARFGDWHHALAAYNLGAARLSRLLQAQPQARDFWDLKLPPETHAHVRRLMSMALLVEQPQRFGLRLPEIQNRPAAARIVLGRPVDLRKAAHQAGIDETLIASFNPGLNRLDDTAGKRMLLLPEPQAGQMRSTLAQARFAPATPQRDARVHVVQPGDSLSAIARRYQVSVEQLAHHNGLHKTGTIRPGRRLELPAASSS
jgi:membrane-bound lytic murein transglycosylase D